MPAKFHPQRHKGRGPQMECANALFTAYNPRKKYGERARKKQKETKKIGLPSAA